MTTRKFKTIALALSAACAGVLATAQFAQAAGLSDFEIETEQRSKIIKQKAKLASVNSNKLGATNTEPQDGECGTQNIGNVNNTGNNFGRAPRENFVFAPGAINLGSNCR